MANIPSGKLQGIESEEDEQFWQHVKQLASQVHVRLVTAVELRDFQKLKRVTARTSEPASSSSNVTRKTNAEGERLPKLEDLTFDSSHFVACDADVEIIPAQKYGPDACGVALMTVEQARKHVDDGIISVDPLAILAVGHQAHQLGTLLQVPAFRKNGTPIIVPACLIQCGDDCVEFRANIPSAETPTVEAVTMEFTLKRTHVDDWKTTATPTHYLGLQCPELRGPGKILASWSIKPFKDRKVCMHSAADSWHGYLKLDLTLTAQVLKRSGFNGIFFTPRGSDKKPHSRFAVVPLPGMTLDKVQKHAGEVANTLGVAVLGSKFDSFGIRCKKEHHDELRAHFFPESIKVDTDQIQEGDMLYTIKHLNAQYNREAMNLALDAVGWDARAIRANGPGSWLIASSDNPPSEHLCLNGCLAVVVGKKLTKPQPLVMTRTAVDMQVTSTHDGSVTVNKQTRVDEIKADISGIIDDKMQVATQQIQMLQTALEDTQLKLSELEKGTQHELNKIREDGAETRGKLGEMEQLIQTNAGTLVGQMKELLDGFHRESSRQNQNFQHDLKSQIGTMQTDWNTRIEAIEREQGKRHKGTSWLGTRWQVNRSARKWWWWFPFWMMWFVETIQLHPICAAAPPYRVDKFLYHYSDCTLLFWLLIPKHLKIWCLNMTILRGVGRIQGWNQAPCVLTYMRIIGPLNWIPLSCHMIFPLCIVITWCTDRFQLSSQQEPGKFARVNLKHVVGTRETLGGGGPMS